MSLSHRYVITIGDKRRQKVQGTEVEAHKQVAHSHTNNEEDMREVKAM